MYLHIHIPRGGSIQFHAHEPTSNQVSKSLSSGTSEEELKQDMIGIDVALMLKQ